MTELRYDAPLATFDGDEWTEFLDDDDDDDEADDVENSAGGRARTCPDPGVQYADCGIPDRRLADHAGGSGSSPGTAGDGFGDDAFSGSLEDLVSCFDENVRHCFRNYSADTEFIAPVQIRTHEQVLHESQSVPLNISPCSTIAAHLALMGVAIIGWSGPHCALKRQLISVIYADF